MNAISAFPQTLSPQTAAAGLHQLCTALPSWPYGALGADNALRLAVPALQRPETARPAVKLVFFAWQNDPLEPRLLRLIRLLHAQTQCLGAAAPVAEALHAWNPGSEVAWALESPDRSGLEKLLHDLAHIPALAGLSPVNRGGLAARLAAEWAVRHLAPDAALEALAAPMPGFGPWQQLREAQCRVAVGQRKEAMALLLPLWRTFPWHPNLILALYELAFPLAPAPAETPWPAILLYSWNKAAVLADTLHSLRESDLGGAPVVVLNNGSTDDTAALLAAQRDVWGARLTVVSLPVNVGAPAARNWLLSLPDVRSQDAVVFLDDDLLLPPDWLTRLRDAAAAFPRAGTVGCRILECTPPYAVQSADFFLLPEEEGQRSFSDLQEQIFVHGGSMGSTDSLLTRHTRSCLSVSGCCHLLRREALEQCGGFDIRFNPSQFDDLERDMRLILAGFDVVCAGQAAVRHVQHSSLRQAATRAKTAHVFGNKIKLEYLYADNVHKARAAAQQRAGRELLRKISRLAALEAA